MSWKRLCGHKDKDGMGFRNLRDFNLALLGKQGWGLLINPDSLVSKVFEARYFPQGSFLTATIGSNPSFVWRSMLEAQTLVKKGPDGLLGMAIPVLSPPTHDSLNWSLKLSGLYSVKSAYKLLQQLNGEFRLDTSTEDMFWKKLWQLKTPPKMKNLLWRAEKRCIPTMTQLQSKRVNVNPICPVCTMAPETIEHSLLSCPVVAAVWDRVGIALCWAIWNARNDKVWQNKVMGIESIVASPTNYLNQWRVAQNSNNEMLFTGFIPGDGAEQWCAPIGNSIKVNVDAIVFSDNSTYGIGFVARDSNNFFVEGGTKLFHGSISPVAEAIGVWEALSWIKDRWLSVVLETDCLSVVQLSVAL
uniref:Reverse transcriptase zinc-binding domain-containing protein n=1 Tax=Cannabis sativa TaxID=3483 RepID=A0A803P564_CANSA